MVEVTTDAARLSSSALATPSAPDAFGPNGPIRGVRNQASPFQPRNLFETDVVLREAVAREG